MHRSQYSNKAERKRLYSTKAWHSLRAAQLREQPLCKYCMDTGKVQAANIVDHIQPHRGDEGLFYDPNNLQSLCKTCHDSTKQQYEKSGTLKGGDTKGQPLDPNHHWNQRKNW